MTTVNGKLRSARMRLEGMKDRRCLSPVINAPLSHPAGRYRRIDLVINVATGAAPVCEHGCAVHARRTKCYENTQQWPKTGVHARERQNGTAWRQTKTRIGAPARCTARCRGDMPPFRIITHYILTQFFIHSFIQWFKNTTQPWAQYKIAYMLFGNIWTLIVQI